MNLCQYKNILGVPGEGIHSYRLFNIAIVDVIGTLIVSDVISDCFNVPFCEVLIIILILALFLHWLFCVPTTVTKALGLVDD